MSFTHPWSKECEDIINKQICMELNASIIYEAMAAYCLRHDVALEGFAKRYRKEADTERVHARMFIDYQLQRGGQVKFENLQPQTDQWNNIVDVVKETLRMEQAVQSSIVEIGQLSSKHKDIGLEHFLEFFVKHQENEVYRLLKTLTQLERVGNEHGLYQFDKDLSS